MSRSWKIYVLKDPRTDEIRYVGMTHGKSRLSQHLYSVKRARTHTASWIKSLLKLDLKPVMDIIEEGIGGSWAERERHWIKVFRDCGYSLTNHTLGGEGTLGWRPNEEQKAKISEATKRTLTGFKHSQATRNNMSAAQKEAAKLRKELGIQKKRPPRSQETIERMSKAQLGKKASAETRKKLSESHTNPPTHLREKWAEAARKRPQEWREQFAKGQLGKKKSEETKQKMAEARRAYWARKRVSK